jgi:kumamolisin
VAAKANYVSVPGSDRSIVAGAKWVGPAQPDERLEVSVHLRRKGLASEADASSSASHADRTPEESDASRGADPSDLEKVAAFALQHGLAVVESSAAKRLVKLSGTVKDFNDAFDVSLGHFEHANFTYRGRTGPVAIPKELDGIVTAVLGLDNRPFARPHFLRNNPKAAAVARPSAASAEFNGFSPVDVANLYGFPAGDGSAQTVGIIELGGGFRPGDLKAYFQGIGIAPPPQVLSFSVDGASNKPGTLLNPDPANVEVMLDIEIIGAIVPKSKIVVYFAPNDSDANFPDAVLAAVHDDVNKPSVISISWGGPEDDATAQFLQAFQGALEDAQNRNITVLTASGDNGAADMTPVGQFPWDGKAHVDFPSSNPLVLACGATRIDLSGTTLNGEAAWNQGFANIDPRVNTFGSVGGGISQVFFPPPVWQANLTMPAPITGANHGRGVPDVTGNGDPGSGYSIRVDGQPAVIGGTSAVAPLWAGLIARINQIIGKQVGFVNGTLYANPGVFNDISIGNNRVSSSGGIENLGYDATHGWDACTGLGSPKGNAVLSVLRAAASNGNTV